MSIAKRIAGWTVAAVLCLSAALGMAQAAGSVSVMEHKLEADAMTLYVRHAGPNVEALIGNTPTEAWMEADASGTRTVTWVLVDNSATMKQYEERSRRLLESIFAEKSAGERFNLCTYAEGLNALRTDARTSSDLGRALDELEYVDQNTYTLDVIMGILDREQSRESSDFVRILILSDGGDTNPNGVMMEQVTQRLSAGNIPIYTILCGEDSQERSNLAALSRLTQARSWELNSVGPRDVAAILSWEEIPVRVEVSIPVELRNRSIQNVRLTFPDGAAAEADIRMPGDGAIPDPPVPPVLTSDAELNTEPVPVPSTPVWLIVLLVLLFLALIGAGAAIFLILRSRQRAFEPVRDPVPQGYPPGYGAGAEDGRTEVMGSDGGGGDGATQILVQDSDAGARMLYLHDGEHNRDFSAPLRETVTIGRNGNNRIVLNYDQSVSGSHCEIFTDGPTFRIRDLRSANGTFVGGIRVADTVEISNGCSIRLGRLNFEVTIR